MRATETTARVAITCNCTVCHGRTADIPVSLIDGASGKRLAEMTHSYVGFAHGKDPVSSIMRTRYFIKAA